MKRVLALLLLLAVVVGSMSLFTGCAGNGGDSEEDEDVGAEIAAYFVGEVYDFDPAKAYTNDDAMKMMSLIYETLFTLDSNGNIQYGLASSYQFYDYRGDFTLDITLRSTCWNDGSQITASDVVYSWKRILDPDFPCQAASLLYEIRNARAAKLCDDKSVDDVAISDQDLVLTITFEEALDYEAQQNFLRNLTSVALAPVKESAVTKADRDDFWSKRVAYIVTSGPFAIRAMNYSSDDGSALQFRLERNNYYRRAVEGNDSKSLYVSPYKFLTYWDTDLDEVFTQYVEGTLFITGDIPLEEREAYLQKARINNLLSTYTYVLDNLDPAFNNAKVRQALSLCIDRAALITEATKGLGIAATGFVSHGVLNGSSGSFSAATAAGESALATTANMDAAVALVKSAIDNEGYVGGNIKLLVREGEEEEAIASLVTDAWKTLFRRAGLSISVTYRAQTEDTFYIIESEKPVTLYRDKVQEAYRADNIMTVNSGKTAATGFRREDHSVLGNDDYNALGIDYQMLSPDAFSALASFSYELSGNGIRMGYELAEIRTHLCGFNNAAYNDLIDAAYAEKNMAARNVILHQAEDLLLEQMPVIPLIFNQSATLISSDLQRVYNSYYGYLVLTRAELRNYHSHLIDD